MSSPSLLLDTDMEWPSYGQKAHVTLQPELCILSWVLTNLTNKIGEPPKGLIISWKWYIQDCIQLESQVTNRIHENMGSFSEGTKDLQGVFWLFLWVLGSQNTNPCLDIMAWITNYSGKQKNRWGLMCGCHLDSRYATINKIMMNVLSNETN
jgi:hypothetical protein